VKITYNRKRGRNSLVTIRSLLRLSVLGVALAALFIYWALLRVPPLDSNVTLGNDVEQSNLVSSPLNKTQLIESPKRKEEPSSGNTRPSVKVLLTTKPPFEDSQVIKFTDTMAKSPNTIVTGYFRVRSKYQPGKYDGWMKNFLSLQDAMVIFTQEDMIDQIRQMRGHALDRTVVVPLTVEQLPWATLFPKEFWEDQLQRDPEKRIHRSYELFWIWLSKTWLVNQAIRMNFFDSDLYLYSDIGCFRNAQYNNKMLIQHRELVPPTEMLQMAHHKPNPPPVTIWNDKYKEKPYFYHSGSQAVAYRDTWIQFHELFLETVDRFLEKNMIIVEDQAVLQSTCLSFPDMCAYLPFTQVQDNHYFGLRFLLYHGGTFNLWRHPNSSRVKPTMAG